MIDDEYNEGLKLLYEEYLNEIDKLNFDIDMYDGDTYMPNYTPISYEDWIEDYEG